MMNEEEEEDYAPLVRRVAKWMAYRHPCPGLDLQDYIQAGWLGLLRAQRRYETSHGVAFATFAQSHIRGAILDEIRNWAFISRGGQARGERAFFLSLSLEPEEAGPIPELHDPEAKTERRCERREQHDRLRTMLAQMSGRCRQVMDAYYFKDMTMREIGEQLGVTESRVCQIHAHCLVCLRRMMRQDEFKRLMVS